MADDWHTWAVSNFSLSILRVFLCSPLAANDRSCFRALISSWTLSIALEDIRLISSWTCFCSLTNFLKEQKNRTSDRNGNGARAEEGKKMVYMETAQAGRAIYYSHAQSTTSSNSSPRSSSDIHSRHQAHTQCTDIQTGKILIHVKQISRRKV